MSPPIPARLAGRPTHRGLVIPWVSVVLSDGTPSLGNLHGTRAARALMEKLCQICGEHLEDTIVLFASLSAFTRGQTSEPGMHPECAAYSAKACPMVNGSMRHFQTVDRVTGQPCGEPGCDCGGWVSIDRFLTDQDERRENEGRPAEPWLAVWVHDYAVGVDPVTRVANAAIWEGYFEPLRVRPIPPATKAADLKASA